MVTALNVANYFLAAQDQSERDITNLKLQKLCAYAQAMSLVLLDKPLFSEPLEAWRLGPVVCSVYNKFSKYRGEIIPDIGLSEAFAREPFDDEQKFILELTANYYGGYSPSRLSSASHFDFPGEFGSKKIIPHIAIAEAFSDKPHVLKLKQVGEDCYSEQGRVSEKEIFDALEA